VPTHASLVTPERVLFEGKAEFVVMRTEGGDIMFLPNHAPFVGAVDITVLRIAPEGSEASSSSPAEGAHSSGAGEVRAAVHGGFVHVADNRVLVLASVAELAEDIDVDRARRALEAAEAGGASGEETGPVAPPEGSPEEGVEQSPTMFALLHPDDPEVAARRARARLEAAGVLDSSGTPAH
jgi:F-type H+-transporting ATPase subunit epsilon